MKKFIFISIICLMHLNVKAQTAIDSLPFSIYIEEIDSTIADLPGIHSFAFARSGSKWLFLTGRSEGLHGFSTNNSFEATYANSNIIVVDTANWQVFAYPVDSLDSIYHSLLRTTNTQFWQEGNNLFILGGYTWEVNTGFYTAPNIISIDVDEMIDAVINQSTTSAMQHIRNTYDTIAAVTGGKLIKLGSDFYLVMGHRFDGFYNQQFVIYNQFYTESFRKFNIADNGTVVSINNYSSVSDSANFHRRDLNVEYYKSSAGQTGIAAYGGVFRKNQDWPYLNPIFFDGVNFMVDTFEQKMSQYTCPVVSLFDSTTNEMFQVFFGGISLYNFNDSSATLVKDSLVPFINDITVQTKKPDGSSTETILDLKMPGLLGSNMVFIPSDRGAQFDHGIYNLRKDTGRTMIGYLYAGIKASMANAGLSSANHKIYRLYLQTNYPVDTTADTTFASWLNYENSIVVFPNPSSETLTISGLKKNKNYTFEITDATGRSLAKESLIIFSGISFKKNIKPLMPGIYFIKICSGNRFTIKRFVKN